MAGADVVVQIHPPDLAQVAKLREGSTLISLLYPLSSAELVRALAARKVTAIAADMIPRTTLAQMMDVLSSQATAAGYYAVLLAAAALPKFFPMLMTAAGTIAPAKVLVLGAGVAGLQAIATARRLGAVVEAFDVRKVVKEQVESLGAKFVEVEGDEDAQTAGGYAKEVSDEYKQQAGRGAREAHREGRRVHHHRAHSRASARPILVTDEMVHGMRAGTVIVDLAAEQGGNCELTKPGKTIVTANGVTIIGAINLPGQGRGAREPDVLAQHGKAPHAPCSRTARSRSTSTEEITKGCVITHQGEIVHDRVNEVAGQKGAA